MLSERLPNKYQFLVISIMGLGAVTAGQAYSWPLVAIPKIRSSQAGFELSLTEESWMASVMFVGNVLSPIPYGYLMDWIGRKHSLLLCSTTAIASWLVLLTFHSGLSLNAARFLMGLWVGVSYTATPVYFGEVVDAKMRGTSAALYAIFFYIGSLFETIVGPYLTFDQLTIASLVTPIVFFAACLFLPESPYYLAMKGRTEAVVKSLKKLNQSDLVSDDLRRIENAVKEQMEHRGSFLDLVRTPAAIKGFVILEVLRTVQRTSGQGILATYASVIIPPSFVSVSTSVVILTVVWFVTSLVGMMAADVVGRKKMLLFSSAGVFLSMGAATVWYFLKEIRAIDTSTDWLPLLLFVLHGVSYAAGLSSIPSILQGELFPVNTKAKASALGIITMALVTGIVIKLFIPLQLSVGTYANLAVCAMSGLFSTIFVKFYMFETKGRTLEEIQTILVSGTVKTPDKAKPDA